MRRRAARILPRKLWPAPRGTNLLFMEPLHDYSLTTEEVAEHYGLSPRSIRDHLKKGNLQGVKINRDWRCRWADVWAVEQGPTPRGDRARAYQAPLLSKTALAAKWKVSVRTVERWIDRGLPTRNVFGSVRIAPVDADLWAQREFGLGRA